MTLLFAGHDTTTSTITFLLYELARAPERARAAARRAGPRARRPRADRGRAHGRRGAARAGDGARRDAAALPAGVGRAPAGGRDVRVRRPRVPARRARQLLLVGQPPPARRVAEPEAFVPERFAPEAKARLPKGAYVPFGGGSRTCIGMRFGQLEIKTIVTLLLQRFRLELVPGPHHDRPPDADAQPARAAADDGARAGRAGRAGRLSVAGEWAVLGSNQRPLPCKGSALPAELTAPAPGRAGPRLLG